MVTAAELLQLVYEQPDGSFEWASHGTLALPGDNQSALMADLDAAAMFGATEFEVTPSGEWLATVAGMTYNVLPGIVKNTGRFCWIGVPITPGGGTIIGNPDDLRAYFDSVGSLSAAVTAALNPAVIVAAFNSVGTLSAEVIAEGHHRARFTSEGSLSALVEPILATEIEAAFTSEGSLTAEVTPVVLAEFGGAGTLSATVAASSVPALPALFTGEGALSARAVGPPPVVPIDPPLSGTGLLADFNFGEGSGDAYSTPTGYTLYAQDPPNAWYSNNSIKGHFIGVVGHGFRDEWEVRLQGTTLLSVGPDGTTSRLEGGADASGIPWTVGIGYKFEGGKAYPGLYDQQTGQWVYSPTPVDLAASAVHALSYRSNAAANTTVLSLASQPVLTLPHSTLRNFWDNAQVLDAVQPQDATLDGVEYYGT